MKKKIAVYALYGSGEHIKECDEWIEKDKDYTKLTEHVEVEFIERMQVDVIKEKVEFYENKKKRLKAEHTMEMNQVDEAIKQLMVIEYKPE